MANEELSELERAMMAQKSYIGASVVVFILYWFFYLPGLIVNAMYLNDASKVAKATGKSPAGRGCLQIMLFLGLIPLIFILIVVFGSSVSP